MADLVRLHIGAPKTGTSLLQGQLFSNRQGLATQGITYPVGPSGNMFRASLDLIDRPWGGLRERVHGEWDALAERVRAASGTVVLSHEILAAASREQATRAIADLDAEVHLIYSARDIARQVPSSWQQSVKHQGTTSFRRYLRKVMEAERRDSRSSFWRVQGLPDVLDRWAATLPARQVHVVTVPPRGSHPDELLLRYCRALGVNPAWLAEPAVGQDNASMGIDETAMLRELNVRLSKVGVDFDVYRSQVTNVVAKQTLAHRESVRPVTLPPRAFGWAKDVAEEWISYARDSGIQVVGDLDDLRPAAMQGGTWENPDKPRPDRMADAAIDSLIAVILDPAVLPPNQEVPTPTDTKHLDASLARRVWRMTRGRRRSYLPWSLRAKGRMLRQARATEATRERVQRRSARQR